VNKTRLIQIGALAATLSVGALGYRWWMNGEPVRIANQIRANISSRNWNNLYDYTVQEEREKNGWTREKFTIFCDHLTKHVQGVEFGDNFKEIAVPHVSDPTVKLWNLANERRFRWEVPLRMAVTGEDRSQFDLNMVRDVDGKWKAMLGPFLRDISRSNRKDPIEHIKTLKSALTAAGLPRYYNLMGDSVLTVSNLDRVIRGEIKRSAAWEKVHPDTP
jgi:hypothetical protein